MRRPATDRLFESVIRLTIPVVDLQHGYLLGVPTMLARRHLVVFDRYYQFSSLGLADGAVNYRGARLLPRQSTVTTRTRPSLPAMPEAAGSSSEKTEDPAHSSQYHDFGREHSL
jgi:hypothetical protein